MPNVLVTGTSRGIGLEFSRQYAADGWDVVACCRHPDKADKLQALAKTHKNLRIEALDVTDAKSIAALAAKLAGMGIDLLINNAGIARGNASKPMDNYSNPDHAFGTLNPEDWFEILRTNTIAPIMVTEAFTPHVERGARKKIAMISSRYGSIELNLADLMPYSTSKAALNMAMRKVALMLKPKAITLVSLHPGWVKTDMGGAGAAVDPETSVGGMRGVIESLTPEQTGSFFGYDGKAIPW